MSGESTRLRFAWAVYALSRICRRPLSRRRLRRARSVTKHRRVRRPRPVSDILNDHPETWWGG